MDTLYRSAEEIRAEIAEGPVDPHRKAAAVLFGKPPEDIQPDERRWAKYLNMAAIEGLSDGGFADLCQLPLERAREMRERYRRLVLA